MHNLERNYERREYYKNHMNRVHKDGNRKLAVNFGSRPRVDPNITPVWDDLNNYCLSCRKTYSSRASYQRHINTFHSEVSPEVNQLLISSNNSMNGPIIVKHRKSD